MFNQMPRVRDIHTVFHAYIYSFTAVDEQHQHSVNKYMLLIDNELRALALIIHKCNLYHDG